MTTPFQCDTCLVAVRFLFSASSRFERMACGPFNLVRRPERFMPPLDLFVHHRESGEDGIPA
jgi:hypothetical protein